MLRTALAVAAGILATIGVACVPPPVVASSPPPPPVAIGTAQRIATAMCGPHDSFVGRIKLLDPSSYQPTSGNGNFNPPVGQSVTWPQPIQDDLNNAFNNAPVTFQRRLCGLTGIYIVCPINSQGACDFANAGPVFDGDAWGFRDPRQPQNTYVGISAGLWPVFGNPPQPGNARLLSDYETAVLHSLPGGAVATASSAAPKSPNDSWMTVLAALAHEVGHVRWTQTVKYTKPFTPGGQKYDFSSLINCPAGDFFVGWNYTRGNSPHPHLQPKNSWRPFRDRSNEAPPGSYKIDHSNWPTLSDLDGYTQGALYALYTTYVGSGFANYDQPWASLFAAQTPDEDFVETYVMAVLMGYPTFTGPLKSLPVTVPGLFFPQQADIPSALLSKSKPTLLNKMSCIAY